MKKFAAEKQRVKKKHTGNLELKNKIPEIEYTEWMDSKMETVEERKHCPENTPIKTTQLKEKEKIKINLRDPRDQNKTKPTHTSPESNSERKQNWDKIMFEEIMPELCQT